MLQNSIVFLLQGIHSGANYNTTGHSKEMIRSLVEEKGLICMGKPKPPVIPISSLYVDDIACDFTCSWGPIKKKYLKKKNHIMASFTVTSFNRTG